MKIVRNAKKLAIPTCSLDHHLEPLCLKKKTMWMLYIYTENKIYHIKRPHTQDDVWWFASYSKRLTPSISYNTGHICNIKLEIII